MSAWCYLLQKEFRMTRNSAFISLAILLVGGLWLVYLSYRYNMGVIIVPASFLLFLLLFYPSIYMLKSLAWEWKVTPHLWLHCPQPAWMLMSAKLAVALLQMLAIILIAAALLLLGISVSPMPQELNNLSISSLLSFVIEIGFYAAIFTFAAGIYVGGWATLISVINHLAGNVFGRFRWLATIATIILAIMVFGHLQESRLFELATHWGPVNIKLQSLPGVWQEMGAHLTLNDAVYHAIGRIYTGEVLFYLLLTVSIYALSAWLIEHKVEV